MSLLKNITNLIEQLPQKDIPHFEKYIKQRKFDDALIEKYYPKTVNFADHIYFEIEDKQQFYNGVRTFLWDTDHCCYRFTIDDIIVGDSYRTRYLTITFTLAKD